MRREELRTPCYIIQEKKIRENLERLKRICDETGCRILLAQKAFSMYSLYPLIGEYQYSEVAKTIIAYIHMNPPTSAHPSSTGRFVPDMNEII